MHAYGLYVIILVPGFGLLKLLVLRHVIVRRVRTGRL